MRFPYSRFELRAGKHITRPTVPITFSFNGVSIPVDDALVDTGADRTILPLEFASDLGLTFDLEKDGEDFGSAGGGTFKVFTSSDQIECCIEQKGFRPIRWKGIVSFTLKQPTILLGHQGCLENLDVTFQGKKKMLEVKAAC